MKRTRMILFLFAVTLFTGLSGCTAIPFTGQSGTVAPTPSQEGECPSEQSPEPLEEPAPPPPTVAPVAPGELELTVVGATGYTAIQTNLREGPSPHATLIKSLEPGIPFTILKEENGYWHVENESINGWVYHDHSLINLPDVIPSIVYDSTNTTGSFMRSSGVPIPGITGQPLYNNLAFNERFGRYEYIMLALYPTAKKLSTAQQMALAEGNSIKLYEAFRPYSVQMLIVDSLKELAKSNPTVMAGINTAPWHTGWFIATALSHHQRGIALDVGLVAITKKEVALMGDVAYYIVTGYEAYEMPTQIHELSSASAIHLVPVDPRSETAWKDGILLDSLNDAALTLHRYFTSAGFVPLSSEWWHFNDLQTRNALGSRLGSGRFTPTVSLSRPILSE